jgi:hypothetical protein
MLVPAGFPQDEAAGRRRAERKRSSRRRAISPSGKSRVSDSYLENTANSHSHHAGRTRIPVIASRQQAAQVHSEIMRRDGSRLTELNNSSGLSFATKSSMLLFSSWTCIDPCVSACTARVKHRRGETRLHGVCRSAKAFFEFLAERALSQQKLSVSSAVSASDLLLFGKSKTD